MFGGSLAPWTAVAIALAPMSGAPTRGYTGPNDVEVAEAAEPIEFVEPIEPADPEPLPPAAIAAGEDDDAEADEVFALDLEEDEDYAGDAYDPLRDSPEALRASGWVRSGVVFAAVGGVLALGGTIMAFTDPCDLDAGNGCQETARDRAALAMAIPGAALFGGGIVMLAVGKRQKKNLVGSLQVLHRGAGLRLGIRF